MKFDLILTFITEFLVILSGLLVYKLAVIYLGQTGFSEYALSRRIISFIQPVMLLGLGVGIPRYVAYATDPSKSGTYFISGLSILGITTLSLALLGNLFSDTFAFLLFGSKSYATLMFPISVMLFGLVMTTACYSLFRGKLQMVSANILQIVSTGIIPVLAFVFCSSLRSVFLLTGVMWIAVSALFMVFIIRNIDWDMSEFSQCTHDLVSYGSKRVPGDFFLSALFTLPATFATHLSGVKEAGYIAFGISMLNMAGTAFGPIGLILLPKASKMIANDDTGLLKYYNAKLIKGTLVISLVGVAIFELFAGTIINLYLGQASAELVKVARIIMVACLAYTLYVTMRSVIDACYVKAINTKNIFISLIAFTGISLPAIMSKSSYISVAVAFVFSIYVLGILTLLEVRRIDAH